jgi:hypothetical protein
MEKSKNSGKIPSSVVIYGRTMFFAGFGKFPYDCIAKDKYPQAAIYLTVDGSSWTHQFSGDFILRNETKDQFNAPLFKGSFTSAPLYKVLDNELNRKHYPELIGKYITSTLPYARIKLC